MTGDHPGEVGRWYMQSPEFADDISNFDVSDIVGVESTILVRSHGSRYPDGNRKVNDQMTMKTEMDRSILRKNTLLFWCTLLVPVAIIALGINFLINPVGASTGFGIPIHDPAASPYMWVKGIRDIFAGLVILPFLFRGDRRSTATIFAISIFVPLGDGLVILQHLGFAPPIHIHWGTALYMTIVTAFLLRRPKP